MRRDDANRGLRSSIFTMALTLAFCTPAAAEIYQWTDAQGTLHFTENAADVPARHRVLSLAAPSGAPRIQRYRIPQKPVHVAMLSRMIKGEEIEIPFERVGNLMKVQVRLNDHLVAPFFVDTGASHISLPESVALALGLNVGSSQRTAIEVTASGEIEVPLVRLDSVQLGNAAAIKNLYATVNSNLEIGLLGGSFFNRFRYSVDTLAGIIILQAN